jgi:hypothetical protein
LPEKKTGLWAEDVTKVVEGLPAKFKALCSNPSTIKQNATTTITKRELTL